MISWRYHLVSIVAVFLALGLGVLTGTTVLNDNLVRNLKAQTKTLKSDLDELRGSVTDLQSQVRTDGAFAEEAMPYVVGGRLATRQAVVVTEEGVDGKATSQIRHALDLAGAEVLTTLTVQPSMAAATPGSQHDLANLLGLSPETPPEQLVPAAAEALAQRLAVGGATTVPEDDILGGLLSQGFLTSSAPAISDATLEQIGGTGQLVLAVGGSDAALVPDSATFMVPFVQAATTLGVTTGAGESLSAVDGFVDDIRGQTEPSTVALVTVDNLDQPMGSSAMVLGLREAILHGTGGNYGVKAGASGLLPPPP